MKVEMKPDVMMKPQMSRGDFSSNRYEVDVDEDEDQHLDEELFFVVICDRF